VEVIADTNVPLDPNVHQAIAMVESEEIEAGKVLGVMQKGYTLNGRTIPRCDGDRGESESVIRYP
jgi:molecular chaperone GrpE